MRSLKILLDSVILASWGLFSVMLLGMIGVSYSVYIAIVAFSGMVYLLKTKRQTNNYIKNGFLAIGILSFLFITIGYLKSSDNIQSQVNLIYLSTFGVSFLIALWLNPKPDRPSLSTNRSFSSTNTNWGNTSYAASNYNYNPINSQSDKPAPSQDKNQQIRDLEAHQSWVDFHKPDDGSGTWSANETKEIQEKIRKLRG